MKINISVFKCILRGVMRFSISNAIKICCAIRHRSILFEVPPLGLLCRKSLGPGYSPAG